MWRIEAIWDPRNRVRIFVVSAAITVAVAVIDWWTKPYVSLGFLGIWKTVRPCFKCYSSCYSSLLNTLAFTLKRK